jgi:hypothetical protein
MAHPTTDFHTLRKVFLGVGIAGLIVSVTMVYKFGSSMSGLHAIGLALTTIACAFMFPAIEFVKRIGMTWGARVLTGVACGFFALELFAHVGYTVGQRTHSTDEAIAQTVVYDNRQEQLASNKQNLAMWRDQLAKLQADNAWTATVKADGLRASLDSATKAIELEEQRGGCKAKCLGLMRQKADLENRIATVELREDLTKRIEATQRLVDKHTETAVETKKGFSPVKAQTDFVSQIYLLATTSEAEKALKPDNVTLTVSQILIGFMLALGMTVLSPAAFYIAFCKADALADSLNGKSAATQVATAIVPAASTHTNTVYERVVEDAEEVRRLKAQIEAEKQAERERAKAATEEWAAKWGAALQLKAA